VVYAQGGIPVDGEVADRLFEEETAVLHVMG